MIDLASEKTALLQLLEDLGSPCTFTQTKAPSTTKSITAGFKTAGVRDEAITNAYGIGAKILTVKSSDFLVAPEKFDKFQFDGQEEVYKAEAVHPIHIGAEVVFWKIYIKGK